MADLTFADSHNMVAYLEKLEDNVDFAEKVNFLNAGPIRQGKDFSGTMTPLFATILIQLQVDVGEGSEQPTNSQHPSIIASPSHVLLIPILSASQPKKTQKHRKTKRKATEISQSSRPTTLVADETIHEERGDSVERASTTATSLDVEQGSGNINRTQSTAIPNDPFPQGTGSGGSLRCQDTIFGDIPAQTRFERLSKQSNDPPISRVNTLGSGEDKNAETRGRYGHDVSTTEVTTISVPSNVDVSAASLIRPVDDSITDDITLAETLIKIKSTKDKGKGIMQEPEKPVKVKGKDQIEYDVDVAQILKAELDEEARLEREREEEASKATNITEWDDVQAMMDVEYELAAKLQAEEQGEMSIQERLILFVELMDKSKKHFTKLRAKEKRRKPPTKPKKRNIMSTYLKNMAGYKHTQLKNKSFEEIQMLFEKEMKRVNIFVDMDAELVKGRETREESGSKRAGDELEQESSKRQKVDDDDDKEREDLKQCFKIVLDEEFVVHVIPLVVKPAPIKLVKTKHGYTRLEEAYERVLWGDLKVMFELDVEDNIWRNLQGQKILLWKLYDYCRIHFVRFENMHIYMLVEKRYPLSPITITDMLNRKLQADY
ncbi:hypothetical protein Tco_0707326 [Tanacetum coccineum]|uniref:Uncharacterized protein n=1 Tax=Tanacetum coccineum TaxID=301880 RepID=A0ABQ4YBZ9_9ASTR